MPTYLHVCKNEECENEWEDFYGIKTDPPKICPKCNQETATRVISGGSGRGIVELTGHELVAKMKDDVKQLKKDMNKSEKIYSNMLGENHYQNMQSQIDKQKK